MNRRIRGASESRRRVGTPGHQRSRGPLGGSSKPGKRRGGGWMIKSQGRAKESLGECKQSEKREAPGASRIP
jgi:hypothetical protein